MARTYFILEPNGNPMDGCFVGRRGVFDALVFADADARVCEFDAAELSRDLSTTLEDVTEDIALDWLNSAEAKDARDIAAERLSNGHSCEWLEQHCPEFVAPIVSAEEAA